MQTIGWFVVIAGILWIHIAEAVEPITQMNWHNHSDIIAVRALFQEIEAAKTAGNLKESRRNFDTAYCPYADDVRILRRDAQGRPRNYYYEGGSDDSMLRSEMYYDEHGVLRFAFVRGGAHNGTKVEYRAYYSAKGDKLWEDDKLLEGPGYTFGGADGMAIADPVAAFDAPNECPEIFTMELGRSKEFYVKDADAHFARELKAGKIQGGVHVFRIVAECDSEKLEGVRDSLRDKEIARQEYRLTLSVNRYLKSKAVLEGDGIYNDWVKQCVIDKYYAADLPMGSLMSPTLEQKIQFSIWIIKGERFLLPKLSTGAVVAGEKQ